MRDPAVVATLGGLPVTSDNAAGFKFFKALPFNSCVNLPLEKVLLTCVAVYAAVAWEGAVDKLLLFP